MSEVDPNVPDPEDDVADGSDDEGTEFDEESEEDL